MYILIPPVKRCTLLLELSTLKIKDEDVLDFVTKRCLECKMREVVVYVVVPVCRALEGYHICMLYQPKYVRAAVGSMKLDTAHLHSLSSVLRRNVRASVDREDIFLLVC